MEGLRDITIALISATSAIVVAWIVNIQSKRVQKRKQEQAPIDRMEQMFDGYARLIKQKDIEDERKARLMAEMEEELKMTRAMVKKLEDALAITQRELADSRYEVAELRESLKRMREEYKAQKQREGK